MKISRTIERRTLETGDPTIVLDAKEDERVHEHEGRAEDHFEKEPRGLVSKEHSL